MLGNPNTPQGERSLEDTEKESEEEGASAGQERSCAWKWCLREQTWVSGAGGSGALPCCSIGLRLGKLSPSLQPSHGEPHFRAEMLASNGDVL